MFAETLPDGIEPGPDDSRSYAEWLSRWLTAEPDADR
jgi:hypothetical protein